MGEAPFVEQPSVPSTPAARKPRSRLHGVDIPLLLAVITLLVFGLLMVYSASWQYSYQVGGSVYNTFTRQLVFAAAGVGIAILFVFIDYHKFKKFVVPMMYGALFLLVLVLFWFGETRLGSRRSLPGGSIQPTEMIKLAIIIYLAFWLYAKREVMNKISFGLIPLIAILGITAGLIMAEPDLSAAITVIALGGVMFFIAGGDLKQLVLVLVVAAILGWIVVSINATGRARLTFFLDGLRDPLQASYQVKRAMEAIVHGGFFGVGIGQSVTKFTGLPVPPTDSIFAVITEETGILGAMITIALYVVILWRGLKIARNAPDLLGKLLASGVTVWLFFEAFVNMAAMVNLIPFAGNALPLISAGGSSLVTALVGLGILIGVGRTSALTPESTEGRSTGAIVNLRRRDGRRSVPRARHTASPW